VSGRTRAAETAPTIALAVAVLALAAGARTLVAQELTGTLYGKVAAEDGSALPGATVTITSPQLIGGPEVRVTSQEGAYRVPSLPPGTYAIDVRLSGFQTVTHSNLALTAGAALAVDVKLKVSGVQESVTVVAEAPLVDVRNTQIGETVNQTFLQSAPVGRSFSQVIITAPGVVDSGYLFAPAQSVQGSSVRDSLYNVDGANANDTTVGYAFMEIPYDIIQEVQVTTAGISAEFGQSSGAVFNFITKSGGNTPHGDVSTFLQNDTLKDDNLTSTLIAQGLKNPPGLLKNFERGFTLGGPIRKDRLWYFGNIRWVDVTTSQPDFPAFNPTANQVQAFGKFTAQVATSTRLQGSYMQRNLDQYPSNASFATNNAPETWSRGLRNQKIIYFGATQGLGKNTLLDATFSQMLSHTDSVFSVNKTGYVDTGTGLDSGGWPGVSGPENRRNNTAVKVTVSHFQEELFGGSHNVKVGFEANASPYEQDRILPGDLVQLLRFAQPYRVDLYNTPLTYAANTNRVIAFVQDGWTVHERVTLNLGVRLEKSVGGLPAQSGGGGQWFPVTNYPQRDLIHWFVAAPRLGLVWDVRGDRRTSLKMSYDRYYNAIDTTMALRANNNTASFQEYDWIDKNGDGIFENGEQGTLRRNLLQTKNQVDPNLKQPYIDAVQLGIDQELGSRFVVSVSGIYKHSGHLLESLDIARPFSAYDAISVSNPVTGQPLTIYRLNPAYQSTQQVLYFTNPNSPTPMVQKYWGLTMSAKKRLSNAWQAEASLTLGHNTGNYGNSFDQTRGNSFYNNPNNLINAYGNLDLDHPVELKLQGTYFAPRGFVFSAYYSGISGYPLWDLLLSPLHMPGAVYYRFTNANNSQIVVEPFIDVAAQPRGSVRADFQNQLSIRGEKQFKVGHVGLDLMADAFNLLNISAVTSVQTLQYGLPNFMKPARIVDPRNVRLGLRVGF
jgi:hypothetical protein